MVAAESLPELAQYALLLGVNVAKRPWTHVQEKHGILGFDGPVCGQDLRRALDVVVPGLVGPAVVQVPPAGGRFVADIRAVETGRVLAR